MLLDKGRRNLLEAALAAGFGSYAQFPGFSARSAT
jgi:hypothetical protein